MRLTTYLYLLPKLKMSGAIPPLPTCLNSFNRRRINRAVSNEVTKNVMMDDTACMGDVEMGNVELHNREQ